MRGETRSEDLVNEISKKREKVSTHKAIAITMSGLHQLGHFGSNPGISPGAGARTRGLDSSNSGISPGSPSLPPSPCKARCTHFTSPSHHTLSLYHPYVCQGQEDLPRIKCKAHLNPKMHHNSGETAHNNKQNSKQTR